MNIDTIPTKGYIRRFRLAELLGVSVSTIGKRRLSTVWQILKFLRG